MYQLIRPLLFLLPPEWGHRLTLTSLHWLPKWVFPRISEAPVHVMGLTFTNPIGIAAGLDKNGDHIDALAKLGLGFIEIGTVTPKPQTGNPKPRLFRLPQHDAIINRMGFNNKGVAHCVERLQKMHYRGILGVNIGKNKSTLLENAIDDYLVCLRRVYPYASYVTINISSPNTPQLRQLQFGERLKDLLIQLKSAQAALQKQYARTVPLCVKISPDLSDEELQDICKTFLEVKIDGIIATNTTVDRDAIQGDVHADELGGLSGAPLTEQSTQILQKLHDIIKDEIPIIAVGGIMTAEDARAKFTAGARLIQLYSGLIYQGPGLIQKIARTLTLKVLT